jgi:hypothetical protein
MFYRNTLIRKRSEVLFVQAAEAQVFVRVPDVLLEDESFARLIAIAKGATFPDPFDLFTAVYQLAIQHRFGRKWRRLQSIINSHFDAFCAIISSQGHFNHRSASLTRLVGEVIASTRRVTPGFRELLRYLAHMFFLFPANSFLHNSFLRLLRRLSACELLSPEIVRDLDLFRSITHAYRTRDTNEGAAFFGHLGEIAELISPLAAAIQVDANEWRSVVVAENERRAEIIAAEYGGDKDVPTAPDFQKAAPETSRCRCRCLVVAGATPVVAVAIGALLVCCPR